MNFFKRLFGSRSRQPPPETPPLLAGDAKKPQVFISYASDDVARAAALHARLTAAGFEVWFDKARLAAGCDWH
jgi:predicted esterase